MMMSASSVPTKNAHGRSDAFDESFYNTVTACKLRFIGNPESSAKANQPAEFGVLNGCPIIHTSTLGAQQQDSEKLALVAGQEMENTDTGQPVLMLNIISFQSSFIKKQPSSVLTYDEGIGTNLKHLVFQVSFPLLNNDFISFDYAWAIFEPRIEIYANTDSHERLCVLNSSTTAKDRRNSRASIVE
ncbi:hypothetical protein FZEAL_6624 [Fusarium zealandicum]|uniref:DUF7025 domain-containing protein n=1 Tax=Fusarium zealandicum TaxID=1053134 RepID=A0A8H4XJA2_9HYPO|nr:hypothetical protein FZEAL_6624 [Fusarium zealandicum]